jgi:hypothetical protein
MLCCSHPTTHVQEDTLLPVCVLGELRRLEVGSNRVTAIEPLEHLLRGLPRLMALDLKGNPVCKLQKWVRAGGRRSLAQGWACSF